MIAVGNRALNWNRWEAIDTRAGRANVRRSGWPKALQPRGGQCFIAKYRAGVGTWNRNYLLDDAGQFVRWLGGWRLMPERQEDA